MPTDLTDREIDALVEQHIFDVKLPTRPGVYLNPRRYTTDGNAMLRLIHRMEEQKWKLCIGNGSAGFLTGTGGGALALYPGLPLPKAIALASLRALGVEVDRGQD